MTLLVLDLESYFDANYSLRRTTIPEYVHDPRFHAHGLAIWRPGVGATFRPDVCAALHELQNAFGTNLERSTVVLHNAYFDLYVLKHCYGLRVEHFVDTMLLAYHVLGRRGQGAEIGGSLKALAHHFGIESKGDLDFMSGVREPDVLQRAKLEEYAKRDAALTFQVARELLPEIGNPRVELPLVQQTVRLFVERGVFADTDEIEALQSKVQAESETLLANIDATAEEIGGNKTFDERLSHALARTGRLLPLKQGKIGLIPATAKTDAAMQELAKDPDLVVAALSRARLGKKSADQTQARLETMRRIVRATGGVLPVHLIYYGGHTGRWSGGGGFNIQNLGRAGIGLEIRRLLKPRSNHVFIIADFAQIEARILAWLAGQHDLLQAFNTGRDVYSDFASLTFSREVRKPREDDTPELIDRLKADRQVGKQAVLGLGFGMGALRFCNMLRADPVTATLFHHGQLTPLMCKHIVQNYREKYTRIRDLWKNLEGFFRQAVGGASVNDPRLAFRKSSANVHVILPSGRALRYPHARTQTACHSIKYLDDCGQVAEFEPEGDAIAYGVGKGIPLYGGKLVENVVQAVARDILAEAILRLEKLGLPVVFHVHDEIVVQVAEQASAQAAEQVNAELCRIPDWASGLPVSCEVTVADRYQK